MKFTYANACYRGEGRRQGGVGKACPAKAAKKAKKGGKKKAAKKEEEEEIAVAIDLTAKKTGRCRCSGPFAF